MYSAGGTGSAGSPPSRWERDVGCLPWEKGGGVQPVLSRYLRGWGAAEARWGDSVWVGLQPGGFQAAGEAGNPPRSAGPEAQLCVGGDGARAWWRNRVSRRIFPLRTTNLLSCGSGGHSPKLGLYGQESKCGRLGPGYGKPWPAPWPPRGKCHFSLLVGAPLPPPPPHLAAHSRRMVRI